MSSLPTIQNLEDKFLYPDDDKSNQRKLYKILFPDLSIPFDDVFQVLLFLQETKVNAQILPPIIRAVFNLTIGSGRGQVIVHVRKDTVGVEMREASEDIKTSV